MIHRSLAASALLAGASLALGGCCAWARALCPQPPVAGPARLSRDSPEEAVDYLIDAFRRRAPQDVYGSLHPEFIRATGGYSGMDFATGYDLYEAEFRADAERLARAPRREAEFLADGLARVVVADEEAGITLYFLNVPSSRVVLRDDLVPEIPGRVPPIGSSVVVEGDELRVTITAPLQGQGAFIDPATVRRVEFHDDWLLYDLKDPRNIELAEVLDRMGGSRP